MNSSHLRLLHFVVQTGGFAAAAREAGVSQPAVTQAMQALERESGLRLFEKVGRHKQPTHAARVLVQQGADLLQCVETLVGAQAKASGGEALAHTLRVGLTPAACLLYGATIERIWRLHAPQGLLQIVSGSAPELPAAFSRGELDRVIAPRPRRYQAEGVEPHLVHVSRPAVYARVGHPLSGATSLQDIQHAGWAVAGRGGTREQRHRGGASRAAPAGAAHPGAMRRPRHAARYRDQERPAVCVAAPRVDPGPQSPQRAGAAAARRPPRYEVCLFRMAAPSQRNAEVIDAVLQAVTSEPEPADDD